MEDLLHLELIEALEDAELNEEEQQVLMQTARDSFVELTDNEFKRIFRLNKELCNFVIDLVTPHLRPRMRGSDLDIRLQVLVALKFFATGSYQGDIGANQFLCASQPSVTRCVKEIIRVLTFPEIYNNYVKFPNKFEELNHVRRGISEKYGFPGIIGCIDCRHVAIFPPKINDPEYPEYLYVNRKEYHSINVQLVCDSNLKIINVIARYPGSTNDAFIWNNSNLQEFIRRLHSEGHKDYFLLGDSGYPQRTWVMTPVEGVIQPGSSEYRYNSIHKTIRSTIERCNGVAIENAISLLIETQSFTLFSGQCM